ncbi:hypothetical protein IscW_ISCW010226 [Ixodes scapularis]|uniref:Secreted protein n=1 Tax=Ixodes scapularis TaxID=6945 RepID=B7Q0S8_IXOSC|nr:hypothetical protein IscW_ISCW010226 [Ixodes scapularis]|eukprot:XP_002408289.1 hypothetical protein IscW_ISCW010226 [Ixodes scapularis]
MAVAVFGALSVLLSLRAAREIRNCRCPIAAATRGSHVADIAMTLGSSQAVSYLRKRLLLLFEDAKLMKKIVKIRETFSLTLPFPLTVEGKPRAGRTKQSPVGGGMACRCVICIL